jgi:hypothetical protein
MDPKTGVIVLFKFQEALFSAGPTIGPLPPDQPTEADSPLSPIIPTNRIFLISHTIPFRLVRAWEIGSD